jgi:hypothetical protein
LGWRLVLKGRRQIVHARKARLKKLLAKSGDGIQFNEHLEGDIDCRPVRTRLHARP